MTTVIASHKTKGYYITLSLETRTYGSVFVVEACPRINDCMCGYPERQMLYGEDEQKKANATFKRYCKKYC